MDIRYKYKLVNGDVVGYYECDVKDFKLMWKKIRNDVDWCCVDFREDCLIWSLCDCWLYDRNWKIKGWYENGWKKLSGK